MLALLRLQGALLPGVAGFWGLVIFGIAAFFTWSRKDSQPLLALACTLQLIAAPLGLLTALRADLVAWTAPLGRARRMGSQWILTSILALIGSLGAIGLMHEFGDSWALLPRLSNLWQSAMIGTLFLGMVFLLTEEDDELVRRIALLICSALYVGWTMWELTHPYPASAGLILLPILGLGTWLYWKVFKDSEWGGSQPEGERVSTRADFPNFPERFISPAPRAPDRTPISAGAPTESPPAILGIASEFRKKRSLAGVILSRGLGLNVSLSLITLFYFAIIPDTAWTLLFLFGTQFYLAKSLKTWACFSHTPWPRSRAFAITVVPWVLAWGALTGATLAGTPFSNATRFFKVSAPATISSLQGVQSYEPVHFSIDKSLPYERKQIERRETRDFGFSDPQEPDQMARKVSRILGIVYGIEATPDFLLSLRPVSLKKEMLEGVDLHQAAWMRAVEEHYRSPIRNYMIRRRGYECLLGLVFSFISLLFWMPGGRSRPAQITIGILAYLCCMPLLESIAIGPIPESTHRQFMDLCDRIPALTIPIFFALSAALLIRTYLAFREWTPNAHTAFLPLRIKLR